MSRSLAFVFVIPMLFLALTACGESKENTSASSSAGTAKPEETTNTDDSKTDDKASEPPETVDQGTLIAAGIAGETAIKCDYTIEANDGVIYLDGLEHGHFIGQMPNGATMHVVLYEKRACSSMSRPAAIRTISV